MSKKDELGGLLKGRSQTTKGENTVKRDFISNGATENNIPKDSSIASNNTSPINPSNDIKNSTNSEASKLEAYRAIAQKKAQKPAASELRQQQNVYIDNNLIAAIEDILNKNKKLQKKDIYNAALQMYLEFAFDMKVTLKEDEYE